MKKIILIAILGFGMVSCSAYMQQPQRPEPIIVPQENISDVLHMKIFQTLDEHSGLAIVDSKNRVKSDLIVKVISQQDKIYDRMELYDRYVPIDTYSYVAISNEPSKGIDIDVIVNSQGYETPKATTTKTVPVYIKESEYRMLKQQGSNINVMNEHLRPQYTLQYPKQENHFITDALFTLVGIGVVGIIAFFGNMGTL